MRPPKILQIRPCPAAALAVVVIATWCNPASLPAQDRKSDVPANEQTTSLAPGSASLKNDGASKHESPSIDYASLLFVLTLATVIGLGVIGRVSRLLHTPLMSLTNAISAIAVVGAILVTGGEHSLTIRLLGAIALFASMTNIVSGFLITDRMLKMFKQSGEEAKR